MKIEFITYIYEKEIKACEDGENLKSINRVKH